MLMAVTKESAQPQLHDAAERLSRARNKAAVLKGRSEAIAREASRLEREVGLAKGRLSLAEEVQQVVDHLQAKLHDRAVGKFEALLTAALHDVFPENGDEKIKLMLGTERGLPALDVTIMNAQGDVEDVLSGKGGAVTNVVCAGLRYSALLRSNNRRFIVLDEPDNWTKPDRVPAFSAMLGSVAQQANVQTLLVSHHDQSYFEGLATIVRMYEREGVVSTEVLEPRVGAWEDAAQPGIREIRLFDVRTHQHTVLPLFPGVTALVGDNDLGKSHAVVAALRAVAYGDSDDTIIRHRQPVARIEIVLEDGQELHWTRRREGSPKVMYKLLKNAEVIAEGRAPARGQVPEFARKALGIAPLDDIDVQVGLQKKPVFLLDEPPSKRAQILAVGKESGRMTALINAIRESQRSDREFARLGEAEYAGLIARAKVLEPIGEIAGKLESMWLALTALQRSAQKVEQLHTRVVALRAAQVRSANALAQLGAYSEVAAEMPSLSDTARLSRVAKDLRRLEAKAKVIEMLPPLEAAPVLTDTQKAQRLSTEIRRLRAIAKRTEKLPEVAPALPVLTKRIRAMQLANQLRTLGASVKRAEAFPNIRELPELVRGDAAVQMQARLRASVKASAAARAALEAAELAVRQSEATMDLELEKLGRLCPLCGNATTQAQLLEHMDGHAHG